LFFSHFKLPIITGKLPEFAEGVFSFPLKKIITQFLGNFAKTVKNRKKIKKNKENHHFSVLVVRGYKPPEY